MRRLVAGASVTGLLAAVLVLAQVVNSAPAAACEVPNSSLCSIEGDAILAETWGMAGGGGGAGGIVGAAETAGGGISGSASVASTVLTTGGAILASGGGIYAAHLLIKRSDTSLPMPQGGDPDGWVPGNTLHGMTFAVSGVGGAPSYGGTGSFQLMATQTSCTPGPKGDFYGGDCFGPGEPTIFYFGFYDVAGNGRGGGSTYFAQIFGVGNPAWTWGSSGTLFSGAVSGSGMGSVSVEGWGETITWYPEGNPSRPEPTQAVGVIEATYSCTGKTGTTTQYVSVPVDASGAGDIQAELPAFDCSKGTVLTAAHADWTTPDGSSTPIYDYTAPTDVQSIPTEYPYCLGSTCELALFQVLSPGKTVGCGQYAVGCPDWWLDPHKTDNYECHYGPYVVDLSKCAIYRNPGKVTPSATVTTTPDGQVQINPSPGTTDPADYPDSDPKPTVTPLPIDPAHPDPSPDQDPDATNGCWPHGWGAANPLLWVYQPVKCALVWAFVPDGPLPVDPVRTALDESPLAVVGGYLGDLRDALHVDGQNCADIIHVEPSVFIGNGLVVNTCDTLLAAVAPPVRTSLSWLVVVLGVMVGLNAIALSFDVRILQDKQEAAG